MAALFTEAILRSALGTRPFRFYPQVGSTNDLARAWALEGGVSGAVVIAEEQISGRGRFARQWIAPPGTALLLSVILRPKIPADRLPRVTLIGAVAAVECLAEMGLSATLKWPNDVQLAGRKVAGVLPEAVWQNDQLSAVVLGIGLNISVAFAGTELAEKAVSLESVTSAPLDRTALLSRLLSRIDYWSMRVMDSALMDAWRAQLNTLGKRVTVYAADGSKGAISGIASDVDDNGALLLTLADGAVQRVFAGEVTVSTDVE